MAVRVFRKGESPVRVDTEHQAKRLMGLRPDGSRPPPPELTSLDSDIHNIVAGVVAQIETQQEVTITEDDLLESLDRRPKDKKS